MLEMLDVTSKCVSEAETCNFATSLKMLEMFFLSGELASIADHVFLGKMTLANMTPFLKNVSLNHGAFH